MSVYAEAIKAVNDAYERACASGRRNMNAMSLATVNADGAPSVRTVLMKSFDAQGLLFFTDGRSRKGRDLAQDARASVCLYWEPIEEQVRLDGAVEAVDRATVIADYAGRPPAAQVLIAASEQSAALESMAALRARAATIESTCAPPLPVPDYWQGYRLIPSYIETWQGSRDRFHRRTAYARRGSEWVKWRLQP